MKIPEKSSINVILALMSIFSAVTEPAPVSKFRDNSTGAHIGFIQNILLSVGFVTCDAG